MGDIDITSVGGKRVIEVLSTWTVVDKGWLGYMSKTETDYAEVLLENGDQTLMFRERGNEKWQRLPGRSA